MSLKDLISLNAVDHTKDVLPLAKRVKHSSFVPENEKELAVLVASVNLINANELLKQALQEALNGDS
jgi:hypothetical protein